MQVEESGNLQVHLNEARNSLKVATEESRNLRLKVKQFESLTDLSELKQENAILSERVSQYEEEKSLVEERCESRWREENSQLEKYYEREKNKLGLVIQQQKAEIDNLQSREMSEETEDKIKSLVKDLEKKMAIMSSENQEEMERLQDNHEMELARINSEHKELTTRLNTDLRLKADQLENLHLEHSTAVRMLKEEMREQLELRDEKQAAVLQEMNSNHQLKVSVLEQELRTKSDWDWEENQDLQDLQSGDSPAIFGVPMANITPHPANKNITVNTEQSLEDNPEFEYLRNILYEYMCGKQPIILAKVSLIELLSVQSVSSQLNLFLHLKSTFSSLLFVNVFSLADIDLVQSFELN